MSDRNEIFKKIAERLVAALDQAIVDRNAGKAWDMPWARAALGHGAPVSIAGRPYRGANYVILSILRSAYPSQIFGTYKAWQAKGAQVRKGERGVPVIFWKFDRITDEKTGERKQIAWARGFTVFAAEQVDGFDLAAHQAETIAKLPNVAQRLEHAEKVFAAYSEKQAMPIRHGGAQAFYAPSTDHVQMPIMEAFKGTAQYYSTLAHELGHSTGHAKRLNRVFGRRFGDETYAAEELVAEITAAMTCAALNIETFSRDDHARYLASWVKVLRDDPKAIVTAASMAQKASDLILDAHEAAEETEAEEIKEAA